MSYLSQFEATSTPRAPPPTTEASNIDNTTANRISTAPYNGVELDLGTIEAIRAVTPVPDQTISFPAYMPDRRTSPSDNKHRPASEHDSGRDTAPVRMKSKLKHLWRSVKKSMARGVGKIFGGSKEE
ncbi:hypothetical protein CLAFUW4_10703 [Fulvia fulva]|uniref:Uncharacterized protein n=1 Tax=Passalora fulva TaxID=5499 RepID=A0A9Q8LEH9_PASFU|nr:uncharacterized protein CLAFUR5_05317 [Fulvia fulva]KAK4615871.1 hypothetical protein CLAFUR4_10708 [Fulvia fulva]KAK4616619.1 hypothetical protein CLAFUR0_10714 [Fulvia fulva]UJO15941.1 hypothetical protein CLAFUR5_05317 [Fulvia fulva]WPV19704.1 hypothetical protein CLAFUW4_10703 [Fulvia fulva]WPV33778.1 hypothetical protein CLAFUW7_10705 [Fulvia fulva]